MHILTLLALLTLLSLGVQLLVSDKVDAVHYGLVLLAGVLILGGQIHENKLNQTLTANKYRTTVTHTDGHQIELGHKNTDDFLADAELEAKTNNDKVQTHNVEDMKSEIITTEKGLTFKLYYDDVKIWNGENGLKKIHQINKRT